MPYASRPWRPPRPRAGADPGKVSLAATYDFTNAYMLRGLLQDDTRVIMFPFAEARIDLHDDDDGVTDVALRIGSWNSLNTGVTGATPRKPSTGVTRRS